MRTPMTRLVSRTVVIDQSDIDTDQIIPARFLTTTQREGLGQHCFADWRYQRDGSPNPEFVLNQSDSAGAAILVAIPMASAESREKVSAMSPVMSSPAGSMA